MTNTTTTQITPDGKTVQQPVNQSVTVTTPDKPARPEWCPEKFWDATKGSVNSEALAKSYTEVEKKVGQKPAEQQPATQQKPADQQQQKPADAQLKPADQQQKPAEQQQQQAPQTAVERARATYADKGELTVDDYTALAAEGYDKVTVDTYLAGVKAQETAVFAEAFALTDGQAGYTALMQWAAANLSQEEQNDFDARVTNTATMKKAVSELVAKQKASLGTDGRKTSATVPNAPSGIEPYKNKQELMAAVKSTEYKSSAEFREQHGRRILASEAAGINLWI